MTGGAYTLHD